MRRIALLCSFAAIALAAACADYATAPHRDGDQPVPCSGYESGSGRCLDSL